MHISKASSNLRRNILEKPRSPDTAADTKTDHSFNLSKHLKKIYPIGLRRSSSSLSFSSLSLSLSQNSNDSTATDHSSISPLDHKISLALRLISPRPALERKEALPGLNVQRNGTVHHHQGQCVSPSSGSDDGEPRRCYWITKSSDKVYVSFHDEHWGVPIYDDRELFELLAMSGMLMDHNWTEILKRKELFREAFAGFDPNIVAKMGDKEITDIASDKEIMLAESRVRCIVDNAKCILKAPKKHPPQDAESRGDQ
ncbi:uncharacterized protein LOC116198931 isoform X2 [Punica granatum]|uniref:Uncharacterized protein LOC116198931 isoform X2 n=1 Tax=Punica granatum TaxID=22663 RepID=A0A6P8CS94_PUNGR|nr:uncharacterized protein LOC116198931 isoform X2 [Punica granatum]